MNKQNAVCVCVCVYAMEYCIKSHKKEWNSDTCFNRDEPWKHCIKWNKSVAKGHILYDFIYMKVSEKPFPKFHSALMPKKFNNALNWPGEKEHWFIPQMSGMVTTGATGQLGVVKNYRAFQYSVKDWKKWLLKFEVKKTSNNVWFYFPKKMDSQVLINDISIVPDSSEHFSGKAFAAC